MARQRAIKKYTLDIIAVFFEVRTFYNAQRPHQRLDYRTPFQDFNADKL